MEIFLMFLIAFGIVGSLEARFRPLIKQHEQQLKSLREDIARCETKLDRLLPQSGQSGSQSSEE